jgi:hypothetical protein
MAQGWWRGVLDTLTARAVRERLDKRRLQAEIDIHRLYLLTAFRERLVAGERHHAAACMLTVSMRGKVPAWCKPYTCARHSRLLVEIAGEAITDSVADDLDQAAQRMGHEVGFMVLQLRA